MSLTLKVNFKKGWPSPSIVEKVSAPASGVTTLEAGMVGHLNDDGKWVLGISAVSQTPFVFRNSQDDPDANRGVPAGSMYVAADLGGIQGISHLNAIEYQTVQFVGTPLVGSELSAGTNGKLKVAATGEVIVAIVTKALHSYQDMSYIQVIPDNSKRLA